MTSNNVSSGFDASLMKLESMTCGPDNTFFVLQYLSKNIITY